MRVRFPASALCRSTERLVVRPLSSKDFEVWTQWKGEPSTSRSDFDEVLAIRRRARRADHSYVLQVFEKTSGAIVGDLFLHAAARWKTQSVAVGYSIAEDRRRLGYGKEAVRAAIDIAFDPLGFHRVEAQILPTNAASLGLARSLGMRHEATFRRYYFTNEAWSDIEIFAVTTEDWGLGGVVPRIGLSLAENL